jgi:hypothetical protein
MAAPIKLILVGKSLICYDKDIKNFPTKYNKQYEIIDTIKDNRNLHDRITKLQRNYTFEQIVFDCIVGRKFGWRFFNDEQKERIREGIRASRIGKVWSMEIKERISRSRKGRGNHTIKHTTESKCKIAESMQDNTNVKGLRWAYNPFTGKERRVDILPPHFIWGRSPEILDYLRKYS